MPNSFHTFNIVIDSLLQQLKPSTFLDVGCGSGKYGRRVQATLPDTRRIGVEITEKYIEQFKLLDVYDEVRIGDAMSVLRRSPQETYDLVIIGDCIEHMPKSVGLDLLNYLTYRSQYIVVVAPEFIIQHEVDGVAEEAHISVWSEDDFAWHDYWAWDNFWTISLFVLRGYQKSSLLLKSFVSKVNQTKLPLLIESGDRVGRAVDLKLRHRERQNVNDKNERISFRQL